LQHVYTFTHTQTHADIFANANCSSVYALSCSWNKWSHSCI